MRQDAESEKPFTRVEARFEGFSAPIPPPNMMREYEEVLPGSADRILSMAEREQSRQIAYDNRGLLFGFVAALALIVLSAYIVSLGFAWQSVGVVIGSIAGTAGTFIYSSRTRRQELRARRAALPQSSKAPELPENGNEAAS